MKSVLTLILIFFSGSLFGQQRVSTAIPTNDSLRLVPADTLLAADTATARKYDIDAVVYSNASDSLIFDVTKKKMYLYGNSDLRYKTTELKSGKIFIDYNTNDIEAYGIADTSDTAKVKLKQTPSLKEGTDNYEGEIIRYNFKSQRGYISLAKNKNKGQNYSGEDVNKVDKNTFFINNGTFTTCDNDTPHTYFGASEMKVIQKDQIIARWIFLYIGGVPFPVPLPFAVFPNETGRRSGIIVPTYGQTTDRGQYFRNLGYFLAINDYMDLALTGDYYFKGGWGARSRFRYAERYNYSGSFNAGYSNVIIGEPNDPGRKEQTDWNLSLFHNQQINPTMRFDVNLQFLSSNYLSNNSISYNDLLSQDITSNATISKVWDESGASMSVNYSRSQNISTGNLNETLPNINFSKSTSYPFKKGGSESLSDQEWYELIGYNYSGQFTNSRRTTDGNLEIHGGFLHNISVNASPKIGYFNIAPNVSYTEKWYNKRLKLENKVLQSVDPVTKQVTNRDTTITSMINELNFVRTFNMSVSASTKLYGIYNPNFLGVESFRHTLMPSVSYVYTPNFASDKWGYWDSYTQSDGQVIRYDKFGREVFGGTSTGESQSLNFSLGNVFEMKMAKSPNDSTKEQKKIQLLNLNASVGYNFAADSLRLSDLNLSYRTQIGDLLNLSGSSSYTFYDYKGNLRLNQFLASNGKGLFRLTNFNFSVSTSLTGERLKSKDDPSTQIKNQGGEDIQFNKKDNMTLYDDSQAPDLSIPWNLSLSYSYNFSKPSPNESFTYSNLNADLGFSLTKNWKFTVRGSYDFDRKQISAPQITIYRDLHCWEMNFTWNPLGTYSGFHFELRLKSSELQDVKITKSGGFGSGLR
ncbi:MAG: LPS-assembly protein LptD [Ignavibacteriae bacterium HGW-Ignavibacteriae-3]|nr:MAG: LPS-assembly protein LptD [Ignavibacteriae bacterium HGW-Ignavibacteriae-3]